MLKSRVDKKNVGRRVYGIDGPGQFPSKGLCSKEGVITGVVEGEWSHYQVKLDNGRKESVYSFTDKGIGWYLGKPVKGPNLNSFTVNWTDGSSDTLYVAS